MKIVNMKNRSNSLLHIEPKTVIISEECVFWEGRSNIIILPILCLVLATSIMK